MVIILARPLSQPAPAPVDLPRVMTWTGFDGSFWNLADLDGPMTMARGLRGLHMPRMDVFTSSSPLVHGVEQTGYYIPERSVYWPLNFWSESLDEWRQAYGGFFDSMHPTKPGVWRVGSGKEERSLELTGDFQGDFEFQNDPFVLHWALIGVQLTAPRPLWRGQPVQRVFKSGEGESFFGPSGGPPFFISPRASFATAKISNPGDEPAYLKWTAEGPHDAGLKMGVGTALIDVPFALVDGDVLIVNTDPTEQYATLNGVDCSVALGFQMFAPVDARGETELAIESTGTGAVSAALTPLFWRAF